MSNLDARLTRLEQRPQASRSAWRKCLAEVFAAPVYDAHREAIIAALCSDMPSYSFDTTNPATGALTAIYVVSWWKRDEGGAPLSRAVILEDDAPLPPGMVALGNPHNPHS